MASAMYPDDTKAPPSYGFSNETNGGIRHQQDSPPAYSPPLISPSRPLPPPAPVYTQCYAQPCTQQPVCNMMIGTPFLGHNPSPVQCPRCHQQVITVVQHEIGGGTWLISLAICLFGGIFGCCLIPFCIPACQDVVHTCPSCRSFIGRRNLI